MTHGAVGRYRHKAPRARGGHLEGEKNESQGQAARGKAKQHAEGHPRYASVARHPRYASVPPRQQAAAAADLTPRITPPRDRGSHRDRDTSLPKLGRRRARPPCSRLQHQDGNRSCCQCSCSSSTQAADHSSWLGTQ